MDVVFFPDAEAEAVKGLKRIVDLTEGLSLRVATQRHPDGWVGTEAIVRADSYTIVSRVAKQLDLAVTIYTKRASSTERYSEANQSARLLEALIFALPKYSSFSGVMDVAVSPIEDPTSEFEIRYLTLTVVLKGSTVKV